MAVTREQVRQAHEQREASKKRFAIAARIEKQYLSQLRSLTSNIDAMLNAMSGKPEALIDLLTRYSFTIEPWAESIAEKMVSSIIERDATAWIQLGYDMNRSLKKELDSSPTGLDFQKFMREQVTLIKSLPLEAGQRVHKVTIEGLGSGRRAEDIQNDILQTGKVTLSRAQLIARTEVARTASGITMSRAKYVGSTHYFWRTSGDSDVRSSHRKMKNKIIAWDDPPEVDPGKFYHAGMFPNCRCYPDPILPDEYN